MDRDGIVGALREQLIEDLFFGDASAVIAQGDDLFELGLDSMGITRLVVFVEKRLGARIADEDITVDHFGTLSALADLVARRL